MIRRSLDLLIWLLSSAFAAAFEFSSLSNATLSSLLNTSASAPSASLRSTSQPHTTLTPSNLQQGHLPPNSNSRGDYVTTQCTTQHPTYTVGLGYTETEGFGDGIVLVGPTIWSTHDVLTFAEVANDLTTTSSDPQTWDPNPFFSGENKTIVTGKVSFISYGREPACTSAFNSYAAANPSTTQTVKSVGTITLSDGQTTLAVVYSTITWPMTSVPHCCGICSIYFNNLQMLYWPALHPNTACLGEPSTSLDSTSDSAETAATDQSVYATDSDGYVYTSPSIYVRFPTVSASDACGLIDSAVTSITLAFSPGELSTYVWNFTSGTTSVLDTANLPCGPWNGTDHFLPIPWSNYSSYQPLIVLPSKLVDLMPAWKSCTADIFEGQDPPRTLSPAAALAPAPTNPDTHAQKTIASPSPSIPQLPSKTGTGNFQPANPDPTQNSPSGPIDQHAGGSGDPSNSNAPSEPNNPSVGVSGDSGGANSPSRHNNPSTGDPGDPGDPSDSQGPVDNAASSPTPPSLVPAINPAGDPPANGPSNPSAADPNDTKDTPPALPPAVAVQGHTITQGAAPVTISQTPVVYQSGSINAGGDVQAIPTGWGQGSENVSPVTVGGLTFSAVPSAAKGDGDTQTTNDPAAKAAQINDPAASNLDPATYVTLGGQTIAVDADAVSVAGRTLKPGDPGVTIDGTPISLGSSVFVVGSRTETLSPFPTSITAQPPYITVGGQTVSISSNAIIVDGTTLKPADPGITINGTLLSLGSSILVVGSHTQNLILPQPTPTAAPSYTTIGGETIAVAASSIVVAGHTMTPGGPAVTADGTLVSLGSSILVIGTQTVSFTLPTASTTVSPSEGIGAMILKGLGGIGAGTVAAPTQTAADNGTRGGNGTVMFMGAAKRGEVWFKGWVAWLRIVLLFVV